VTAISLVLVIHAHVEVLLIAVVVVLWLLVVEVLVVLHLRELVLLTSLVSVLHRLFVISNFIRASDLKVPSVSLLFKHISVPVHLVLLLSLLIPSEDINVRPSPWSMVHLDRRPVTLTHIILGSHLHVLLPEPMVPIHPLTVLPLITTLLWLLPVLLLLLLGLLLLLLKSIVLPLVGLGGWVSTIFLAHVLLIRLVALIGRLIWLLVLVLHLRLLVSIHVLRLCRVDRLRGVPANGKLACATRLVVHLDRGLALGGGVVVLVLHLVFKDM
jgi:hypothetical protein